jgi:competence protein ComEC
MPADNTKMRPRIPHVASRAIALPVRWSAPTFTGAEFRGFLARQVALEVEQRRLFPWLAVCFGLGILLFFSAEGRPALWAPAGAALICTVAAPLLRSRPVPLAAMIGMAALFAGFAAAVIRTRSVEAPVLARTVITPLQGYVEAIEERPGGGARLTIRVSGMDRVPAAEQPRRVRVTTREAGGLAPGQVVGGMARLLPPPQPAWPGGYDFARDAFYREIGAVGSFVGKVSMPQGLPAPDWPLTVAAAVDAARNALTQRIAGAIGGQPGAVAAALVTGKRGLIEEPTNDVLRAAGI